MMLNGLSEVLFSPYLPCSSLSPLGFQLPVGVFSLFLTALSRLLAAQVSGTLGVGKPLVTSRHFTLFLL